MIRRLFSLRFRTPALALAVLPLLVVTAHAVPADKCLAGASLATDTTQINSLRNVIDVMCDCASFDGLSSAATHGKYTKCAKDVVKIAVAGGKLRTQCQGFLSKVAAQSTCGFKTTPKGDKVACVKKVAATGKVTCAIKPALTCVGSAGKFTQTQCASSFFCLDASDSNADLLIDASDSGACSGGIGTVAGATFDIPSAAQPANSPGSPGVVVTNPLLQTQFGKKFSLNNARYTRYRYTRLRGTPDAILVVVPGFEGGASGFKILADNLITRMRNDYSRQIEVWAIDRRTNQLEDSYGLDVAEIDQDPLLGLDWLFGAELNLSPLSPELKRRAVFYDAQADTAFMANWTNLVFSRDVDAVVTKARGQALHNNVFLGGHSAGTGFAARYASTDFDLTGIGPVNPGYAKVRGLVLLEGGGGSNSGTPLTSDSLDRMIAKFDGGLYAAVRENFAKCVDGTDCQSDADCAGKTPAKCTPPTTAYARGLLNPRLLAAVEPAAIQGIGDPDSGQIILQQLFGGSTPIQAVPDLGSLSALPQATVLGGIGSFIDDDGLIASFATFISTSVGSPGPIVSGLTTWLDITESASFPPCPGIGCVTPFNGAPPTTLPGNVWGQEKEVTSFARLLPTFYEGKTNFVDWYYPTAGPSVTSVAGKCSANPGTCTVGNVGAVCSGATQAAADSSCSQSIGLDSSALSIGRGRRDIENLTQSANINVPVIAFGGSNGLVPVPGGYVPFGTTIGICTAPSCDGSTPRVVNTSMPSAAFPTFGGIAGGYEVYMSEGFAHVDVLASQDDANNNVIAPLAAFLQRNVQ